MMEIMQQFHSFSHKYFIGIELKHACMINVCGYTENLPLVVLTC